MNASLANTLEIVQGQRFEHERVLVVMGANINDSRETGGSLGLEGGLTAKAEASPAKAPRVIVGYHFISKLLFPGGEPGM